MDLGEKPGGGEPEVGGETAGTTSGPRVSEEVVWKARAQDAEERVTALEARVRELEDELGAAREAIDAGERRREIDRCAGSCGAIDPETVALLTELAVERMDEPDVRAAIEELRRTKPFLFARRGGRREVPGSMSAAVERAPAQEGLGELADEARSSGDRRVLLQYLRQRRAV